jgi:hypothetical protein
MKWFLLISFLLLQGCSTMGGMFGGKAAVPEVRPVEVVTITEPAPMYHPPLPESVVPAEVEWTILNPSVMREYIENYDQGDAPAIAYYGLSSQGYENLSNNFADVRRYIRQVLNIIKYYRDNDPTKKDEPETTEE